MLREMLACSNGLLRSRISDVQLYPPPLPEDYDDKMKAKRSLTPARGLVQQLGWIDPMKVRARPDVQGMRG